MNGARTRRLTAAALAGTTLAVAMASTALAQPVKPETLMAERSNPAVQLVETTVAASVSMRNIDLTVAMLTSHSFTGSRPVRSGKVSK